MTTPTIEMLTPAQRAEVERIRATRERWASQLTTEVDQAPPVTSETMARLVTIVRAGGSRRG